MEPAPSSLSISDWMRLDRAVLGVFAPGLNADNYVQRCLAAIRSLVAGEFATYSRARPGAAGTFEIVFSTTDPLPLAPLQAFMSLKDQYWLWNPEFTGAPAMRSDFFSERQFRDEALFTEAYRPFGLSNHLCIPVMHEAGAAIHFSVQRNGGVDFSERDRAVITLLQPHLASARALARERTGAVAGTPAVYASLGLTPREAEVFHWLVEGKRNQEIAGILRLRVQTVKGHVAEIFHKLHVENRHSAMRMGFETARRAGSDELVAASRSLRTFSLRRT